MKKEYIKPTMAIETIEVELPLSMSVSREETIDSEGDFLTKERDSYGFFD